MIPNIIPASPGNQVSLLVSILHEPIMNNRETSTSSRNGSTHPEGDSPSEVVHREEMSR